jgi:hypothetical protein
MNRIAADRALFQFSFKRAGGFSVPIALSEIHTPSGESSVQLGTSQPKVGDYRAKGGTRFQGE